MLADTTGANLIGFNTGTVGAVLKKFNDKLLQFDKSITLQPDETYYLLTSNYNISLSFNMLLSMEVRGSNFGVNRLYYIGMYTYSTNTYVKEITSHLAGSATSVMLPIETELLTGGASSKLKITNNTSVQRTIQLSGNILVKN